VTRDADDRRQTLIGMSAIELLACGVYLTWDALLDDIALSVAERAAMWERIFEEEGQLSETLDG